eukprot:Clim_evm21s145 gene=Clim_evmTU21s145
MDATIGGEEVKLPEDISLFSKLVVFCIISLVTWLILPAPTMTKSQDSALRRETREKMCEVYDFESDEEFQSLNGQRIERVVHQKTLSIVHTKADTAYPTIFMIHGIGGGAEQWIDQFLFYKDRASIVIPEFVGHGQSQRIDHADHYRTDSIVADMVEIFKMFRSTSNIVFAHSYGTSIVAKMAKEVGADFKCVVLFGPSFGEPGEEPKVPLPIKFPDRVFDLFRYLDKIGGTESSSVKRFVHPKAKDRVKRLQLAWNMWNPTYIVKHVIKGASFATPSDYENLECPVMIIVGADDKLTPPAKARRIQETLGPDDCKLNVLADTRHQPMLERKNYVNALLDEFLVDSCGIESLSRLHILRRGNSVFDKWGVKNYEKWKATQSVGAKVGKSVLRGIKVMREDDEDHSPEKMHEAFPDIGCIIDLSSQTPPYDTEKCPILYKKMATVSKVVPSEENVKTFVELVNKTMEEDLKDGESIAVHCHYGFNRTGFMIASYLIEALDYSVSDAIKAYKEARPPGIKHQHFMDRLYLRYPDQHGE